MSDFDFSIWPGFVPLIVVKALNIGGEKPKRYEEATDMLSELANSNEGGTDDLV